MDRKAIKAIIMAIMSPVGIGGSLNKDAFANLDKNSQRIVDHCMGEEKKDANKEA